jgi:ribosome biogenesis GTPase A
VSLIVLIAYFYNYVDFRRFQEVELDKNIRLIDSPGVVFATSDNSDPAEVALKNALRVDTLSDPVTPVMAILRRCSVETVCFLSLIELMNFE